MHARMWVRKCTLKLIMVKTPAALVLRVTVTGELLSFWGSEPSARVIQVTHDTVHCSQGPSASVIQVPVTVNSTKRPAKGHTPL
eukprot:1161662-Pelagomonas_calceolata.AAC.19